MRLEGFRVDLSSFASLSARALAYIKSVLTPVRWTEVEAAAVEASAINTAAEEKCMSAVLFSGVIELWRGI